MSICFQTVPCDYSPAVFARNLTERRFGSLLYVYNGVFDLKPTSVGKFRRVEKRRSNPSFAINPRLCFGVRWCSSALDSDKSVSFAQHNQRLNTTSLVSRYGIFLKARCVRVRQIGRILIRLIEHFSLATRTSALSLDQGRD